MDATIAAFMLQFAEAPTDIRVKAVMDVSLVEVAGEKRAG